MKRLMRGTAIVLLAVLLVGCASVAEPPLPADGGPATHTIYVLSDGWHSGVVLARSDIPAGRVREAADFPKAAYLEFGWGDRAYYPSPNPGLGTALAAALVPTPSVVHMAGRERPPVHLGRGWETLVVHVNKAGIDRLVARLDATFARPEGGRAPAIARGLYPNSRFYPAHGQFYLFNTCNTWTARMLAAAGVPMTTGVITADDLMRQLRELSRKR